MAIKSWRRALWVPGLRMMGRLRMRAKLSLVFGMLALPLLALLLGEALQARDEMARLEQKIAALPVARELLGVQHQLGRLHLQADLGRETGDSDAAQQLARHLAALDRLEPLGPALMDPHEWPILRQQLQPSTQTAPTLDQAAALQDKVLVSLLELAERSGLLQDNDRRSYALADLATSHVNLGLRELVRLRGHLEKLTADAPPSPNEQAEIIGHAEALGDRTLELAMHIDQMVLAGGLAPASWGRLRVASDRLIQLARTARHHGLDRSARQLVPQVGSEGQAAMAGLGEDLLADAARRLTQRRTQLAWQLALHALLALGGLAAGAYLAATFYWSFSASLRSVTDGVMALTQGDLSRRFRVLGADELTQVITRLDGMADHLSAQVAEIRSSAVRVDQSGLLVAADGQALAQRNLAQGHHLDTTAQAVASLDSALQHSSNHLGTAHRISRDLQQQAESGHQSVGQALGAVQTLEASVRRIAEINAAIDDVAFQTNLLALNASVEAARAGEAGKGFAVVAHEVRQLAVRCSEAAAQVRSQVDQSLEQAALSMATIDDTQTALHGVSQGLAQLGERLGGLDQACGEHTRLIGTAREGLQGMQALVRDNGSMVQQASASSQALAAQAGALRRSVASTRLRQGSADEAKALLERALAHVAQVGWAEAAAQFNDPAGGFVDRDMYIYALDADDRYLVDGSTPARVGHRMVDVVPMPGERVERFIADCRRAAAQGGGWVDYEFVTADAQSRPVRKSGYVMPLGDGFIGCSVYRTEAGDGAGAAELPPGSDAPPPDGGSDAADGPPAAVAEVACPSQGAREAVPA